MLKADPDYKKLLSFFAVALIVIAVPLAVSARPLTPERFRVDPGSYGYWVFEVARSARVFGQFRVQDGGGNDIQVFLMDEGEFENFRNGKPFRSYYSSNRVGEGEISLRLYSGRYVIIFDNRFSPYAGKTITSNLQLEED